MELLQSKFSSSNDADQSGADYANNGFLENFKHLIDGLKNPNTSKPLKSNSPTSGQSEYPDPGWFTSNLTMTFFINSK